MNSNICSIFELYYACKLPPDTDSFPDRIDLDKKLLLTPRPAVERFIRKNISPLLEKLPSRQRLILTQMLKKIRKGKRKIEIESPAEAEINQLFLLLAKKNNIPMPEWNGKKSVLCITHDVDNSLGYDFVRNVLDIEKSYSVCSTFNFVTNYNYRIGKDLLDNMLKEGYEIGLHGYSHDIALAYRKPWRIKDRLAKAIETLGGNIRGFRAPALAVSETLFRILEELGIKYDSSLPVTHPFYTSVRCSFPYKYPGRNLWEIPLSLQDDTLFRDANFDNTAAMNVILKNIKDTSLIGGVCVVNFHPHILVNKIGFYKNFLETVRKNPDLWITPTGVIFDCVNAN